MNNQQTLVDEAVERLTYIAQRLGEGTFTDLLRYYPQATSDARLSAFAYDFRALLSEREETKGVVEALRPFADIGAHLQGEDLWGDDAQLRPMDEDGLTIYGTLDVGDFRRAAKAYAALSTLTQEKTNVG